ncbi:MAG: RpiB/LacA/LacB family sugar-phosphate isomerase [Minisyncoccia bacterium]
MIIYLGSDHQGFKLKEHLFQILKNRGYDVVDVGNYQYDENDDYPDFASKVAWGVSQNFETAKGIVICGSGVGVDVVANKFINVRCSLCFSPDQAFDARNDDDANILALPAKFLTIDQVLKIVNIWLMTSFSGSERHSQRIKKIQILESKMIQPIEQDEL